MQKYFFFIGFVLILISCNDKDNNSENTTEKDTLLVQTKKNIHAIGVTLSPEASEFVSDWAQYIQFDTFINRYYAISNAEALHNAKDLSKMATELKDSTNYVILQEESTLARFNILDSECKRLADMATIKAITPPEVSLQIKKILEAFSAVNAKINSIIEVENLESELQLDPDFKAILNQIPEADKKNEIENPLNEEILPNQKRLASPKTAEIKFEKPATGVKRNIKEKIIKDPNREILSQ